MPLSLRARLSKGKRHAARSGSVNWPGTLLNGRPRQRDDLLFHLRTRTPHELWLVIVDASASTRRHQALSDAKATRMPVLVIFGANWCKDCRALDQALSTGRNSELVKREFRVVKVDVGPSDEVLTFNKGRSSRAATAKEATVH